MKKVPSIISTKDLSYIEDIFNWSHIACKKSIHYKSIVENKDVENLVEKIISTNQEICERLINILE